MYELADGFLCDVSLAGTMLLKWCSLYSWFIFACAGHVNLPCSHASHVPAQFVCAGVVFCLISSIIFKSNTESVALRKAAYHQWQQ
jgi:hypothetical protein